MRGHEILFTNLFPSSVNLEPTSKGQRKTHTSRRDDVLAVRYYYYIQLQRKRYDDSLQELEKEFFITPPVIVQRLTERQSLLKELVSNKPGVSTLRKQFPHFSW